MSLSGNLKTVSFPDILQLLATGKKTGILEVSTPTRQKEVAFKDGNIIYASSVNSNEDLLGNMLLRRGKISKSDLDRAVTLHKQTGRQLGTTLVDMNLFEKDEIAECLKLQIEEIVYNLFSWNEGNFLFREGEGPRSAPFTIELNTMNVVMEGTRRIDEWLEIQKVVPPDDVLLRIAKSPKTNSEDISISLDEFKVLSLINGERTLPELIDVSPMGEFVTCRAVYRLILGKLIEVAGRRESEGVEEEDEEEVVLSIIFHLYNKCFYRIRNQVEDVLGEGNQSFSAFASQFRAGVLTFFPGIDPGSELGPSFDKFLATVRNIPVHIRLYTLMSGLERMLSEQLLFTYQLLGIGPYRESMSRVKREISEPLAVRRELVKRYALDEHFYGTIKRTDKIVKTVRG
jgi:hypothetical protein